MYEAAKFALWIALSAISGSSIFATKYAFCNHGELTLCAKQVHTYDFFQREKTKLDLLDLADRCQISRLGSPVITIRVKKSTRFPERVPRRRPYFPFESGTDDFDRSALFLTWWLALMGSCRYRQSADGGVMGTAGVNIFVLGVASVAE